MCTIRLYKTRVTFLQVSIWYNHWMTKRTFVIGRNEENLFFVNKNSTSLPTFFIEQRDDVRDCWGIVLFLLAMAIITDRLWISMLQFLFWYYRKICFHFKWKVVCKLFAIHYFYYFSFCGIVNFIVNMNTKTVHCASLFDTQIIYV